MKLVEIYRKFFAVYGLNENLPVEKDVKLIQVKEPFRHAINGNIVVEFSAGVHEVDEEIAVVAVEHLKVAELTKDNKNILPKITRDINGNLLPNVVEEEPASSEVIG